LGPQLRDHFPEFSRTFHDVRVHQKIVNFVEVVDLDLDGFFRPAHARWLRRRSKSASGGEPARPPCPPWWRPTWWRSAVWTARWPWSCPRPRSPIATEFPSARGVSPPRDNQPVQGPVRRLTSSMRAFSRTSSGIMLGEAARRRAKRK